MQKDKDEVGTFETSTVSFFYGVTKLHLLTCPGKNYFPSYAIISIKIYFMKIFNHHKTEK